MSMTSCAPAGRALSLARTQRTPRQAHVMTCRGRRRPTPAPGRRGRRRRACCVTLTLSINPHPAPGAYDDLRRAQKAGTSAWPAWPAAARLLREAAGAPAWPRPDLPFLFAGAVVEADKVQVYVNNDAARDVQGVMLASDAEAVD